MLRDCSTVRARCDDHSFDWLEQGGLALPTYRVPGKIDWQLTRDGKIAAMQLPPFA